MKHVKMLGLAAVAAMALMAFVGAGTASAAVVCSTTVSPCPEAQRWPNGTVLDFSSVNSTGTGAGKAVLSDTTSIVKNECESTVQGTLTNNPSTPTLSGITLTWTNCTRTTANVEVGTLGIENIAGTSNGTVKAATRFQVTSKVPSIVGEISCVFEAAAGQSLGEIAEGIQPLVNINTVVKPIAGSNSNCPSSAKWVVTYKLTTPANTTASLSTS